MGPKSSGRLIIWFVMRSRSTALVRALGQIPNIYVFFEPFYTAAAYGPERRFAGFTDEVPEEPEATYGNLQTMLQEAKTPVLVKDCSSGMPWDCFAFLPRGYRHVFLIRDPLDICASIDRINQLSPAKERAFAANDVATLIGYKDMRALFDYLSKTLPETPIILQADDLIARPSEALERLCAFGGLPAKPGLISWPSLKRFPSHWWVSRSDQVLNSLTPTYENALKSGGFAEGMGFQRKTVSELPPSLVAIAEEMQDDYVYLLQKAEKFSTSL